MRSEDITLRVRINQIDHTMIQPGPLDNSALPRVPVIRIFGESSAGKKACVHVHQVYPYFFIEYPGKMEPTSVNRYISRLTQSLNHAITISLKRNPLSPSSNFVRAIVLVKGVHFYGFHASYSPFLKIYITDPAFFNRAVTIMHSGTIMKTRFRTYESHLSFVLQFMSDFGLYGCGWIDLGQVWQRGHDAIQDEEHDPSLHIDDIHQGLEPDFKHSPYFRQSRMTLELDVAAHQILNRCILSARNIHHNLVIPEPTVPLEPLVPSVRELWEDERRRRIAKGLSPSPEIPKDLSECSRGSGGGWISEARYWEQIKKRIEKERNVENILENGNSWERWVMTTFESVEALWETEYKTWKPMPTQGVAIEHAPTGRDYEENPFEGTLIQTPSQKESLILEVDEAMLSSQAMHQLVELEEKDWEKALQGDSAEAEDDQRENDDVAEGPPPDIQLHDDIDGEIGDARTPNRSPRKRLNTFVDAWAKISGYRSSSVLTPSRSRRSPLMVNTPASRKEDTATRKDTKKLYIPALPLYPVVSTTPESSQGYDYAAVPQHDLQCESPTSPKKIPSLISVIAACCNMDDVDDKIESQSDVQIIPQQVDVNFLPPDGRTRHACTVQVHAEAAVDVVNMLGHTDDAVQQVIHDFPADESVDHPPLKRRKLSHEGNPDSLRQPLRHSAPFPRLVSSSQNTSQILRHLIGGFCTTRSYIYATNPPTVAELRDSIEDYAIPSMIYQDPHYSQESDVPDKAKEYAGLVFHIKGGDGLGRLDDWVGGVNHNALSLDENEAQIGTLSFSGWEYASFPPSRKQVIRWLNTEDAALLSAKTSGKRTSQIGGPTQANVYGLKASLAIPHGNTVRERLNMSILALEVFAPSHTHRLPDPESDQIVAVSYSYQNSDMESPRDNSHFLCESGLIVIDNTQLDRRRLRDLKMDVVASELDLLNKIIDLIVHLDPDIIAGWEVQTASWGYLKARADTYGMDLGDQISRAPGRPRGSGTDQWGMRTTSTFKVVGRHVLNLWRIMRSEQTLGHYSFENVVFHLLRRRTPRYTSSTLSKWYYSPISDHTARVLTYLASRTSMVLEIIDAGEVVTKNAEFARVFGVDFFSVLSRGSQFKVESFMSRIAKPESFVLLSPSKEDVGKQNAAECMPLIMEPLSAFYSSPLVVLDFQSLYPSIMIAYNYCYSTCLGRVTEFKGQNKLGVTELRQPAGLLETLQEHINVAPNGIMYVKPEVRKGLLGRMLKELLDTRVMVKQAMKGVKDDKALRRILDARQLGLKFIANVTYGYTSATYSGRMPAVEIADSIVQSGRETLERAIRVINSTPKWGAKVVYGDTDSVFIYLRGKTKEQAFRIGQDMADTITAMNPAPVKLKFEKVYLPCVLLAKKRYVGFKFEAPDEKEPGFDAKGIETVRRDGIPAQQKMTETCLKILFRTQDLSEVKDYCCKTWSQILENKVSVQDFIFAKEVKMGTYSDKGPPPPGVTVAARRMTEDPTDEPHYGERVQYVIVRGEPNSRLVDRAVAPEEVLNDSHKYLDATYYISRVLIPPLERIFSLLGADVRAWYDDMPKTLRADPTDPSMPASPRKGGKLPMVSGAVKIDEHFQTTHCLSCGVLTPDELCDGCLSDPQSSITNLLSRVRIVEKGLKDCQMICASCTASAPAEPIECESLDCPWLFERKKAEGKAESVAGIKELVAELEEYYDEQGA